MFAALLMFTASFFSQRERWQKPILRRLQVSVLYFKSLTVLLQYYVKILWVLVDVLFVCCSID
jgi:hypothetical protein